MIRNLKALGIVLGAVFALSAAAASSASAVDTLTTSVSPAVVTGLGTDTLFRVTKADGGTIFSVKCATTKYAGTVAKSGTKEVTLFATAFGTKANPNSSKCESSLGEITVDMNGCDYVLTGETISEDKKAVGKDARVWITCPIGKAITVTAPAGCTLTVSEQTLTEGGVVYTNGEEEVGGKKIKDVTIDGTETGITFSSTAACQLVGIPKEGNNIDENGTITATCWEDKGKGASEDEFIEGAACNLEVSQS